MWRLKLLLTKLGFLVSYIASKKLIDNIQTLRKYFYTGWHSRFFFEFGKNVEIVPKFERLIGAKYISIGNNVKIDSDVALTAWDRYAGAIFTPEIIIEDGTCIGANSHITSINCIHIGKNVLMGKKVLISDNSHGTIDSDNSEIPPGKRPLYSKGPVIIEDNVWIGEKASILSGVRIGVGSIIGANAVVTKNIPPYTLVAGIPARIIKKLK